jgi:hypothetical protein
MQSITSEIRHAIELAGDQPVELTDPLTHEAYILLRKDIYSQLNESFRKRAGSLSLDEQRAILSHVGKRAGWDDPAMDVYDDLAASSPPTPPFGGVTAAVKN